MIMPTLGVEPEKENGQLPNHQLWLQRLPLKG
jgi:hypothetical protein